MIKTFGFVILSLFFGTAFAQLPATKGVVIADFEKKESKTNLAEEFGTWDKDPADKTQGCKMSFVNDDAMGEANGRSIRLDYDVDSPNPAYNGFWLKISKAEATPQQSLSFYIKGDSDAGFTRKVKIELKDKKRGKGTFIIENITDKWQKISLTFDPRSFDKDQSKPFEEFVVVFDDQNSSPKKGAILIDQIEIE